MILGSFINDNSLQPNRSKCIHCKLKGCLEEFCRKKFSKRAQNRNQSTKSLSENDEDSNKNSEKRKGKNGKLFAVSVVMIYPEINLTVINKESYLAFKSSTSLFVALFTHENS